LLETVEGGGRDTKRLEETLRYLCIREKRGKLQEIIEASLLRSAYKIYAEMLRNRLKKEVEVMGLISESYASFRKKRSTIERV